MAWRRLVGRVVARHGGLCIGRSPGELYDQKKFDTPAVRDYLLDRGALADVSETSAPWSLLPEVYDEVMAAAREAFARLGVTGYIMCHLSHSYHAGACLCFTFAIKPARRCASRWTSTTSSKSAIQQAFIDAGATCPPPRGRHRARSLARGGHLRRRGGDGARAAGGRRPRRQPQPRQDHRRTGARPRAALAAAEYTIALCPERRRAASRPRPPSWSRRCAATTDLEMGFPSRARPAQR